MFRTSRILSGVGDPIANLRRGGIPRSWASMNETPMEIFVLVKESLLIRAEKVSNCRVKLSVIYHFMTTIAFIFLNKIFQ
jgi:hypothetical protein